MSRIDDLIAEHCPNGVEFKELGEVIVSLRTGLNPRQNFKLNPPEAKNYYVTVRDLYGFEVRFSDKIDHVDNAGLALIQNRSKLQVGDVLFSATGTIGRTALVVEPPINWNIKEGVYAITPVPQNINAKFLIYLFHSNSIHSKILAQADGSTVVSIGMAALRKIRIPVPPLEIQREIVKVLDTFTKLEAKLEAELEAELEARRQQYKHYRDALLSSDEITGSAGKQAIRWIALGEIAEFRRGTAITEKQTMNGEIPVVANGPVPTYFHGESNRSGETIVVARSGAYAGYVSYWVQPLFLTDAFSVHPDSKLLKPKFLYYVLRNKQEHLHSMKKGSGVPHVRVKDFEAYIIPFPPLEEQKRIVGILDKFDATVNDLSSSLPAEIKARRQQYEHYRNRLLTFREIA